jgi:hypothetical protein
MTLLAVLLVRRGVPSPTSGGAGGMEPPRMRTDASDVSLDIRTFCYIRNLRRTTAVSDTAGIT